MNRSLLPALFFLLIVLCASPANAASTGVTINLSQQNITLGEDVTLYGTAYGGPPFKEVYLFMTGPGLDPAGVMLMNTTIPAKKKSHVKVPVDNTRWEWIWHTQGIRGPLETGNYTLYTGVGPFDTEQLTTCDRCLNNKINITIMVPERGKKPDVPVSSPVNASGSNDIQAAAGTTPVTAGTSGLPSPSKAASPLAPVAGLAALTLVVPLFRKRP